MHTFTTNFIISVNQCSYGQNMVACQKCRFLWKATCELNWYKCTQSNHLFFFMIISVGGLLSHGAVRHVCLTPLLVTFPSHKAECHDSRAENNSTKKRCHVETRRRRSGCRSCWHWKRRRRVYSYVTTYNHHMHGKMDKQRSTRQISQSMVSGWGWLY